MIAPDLRPKTSDSDAPPMETSPSIQLEHQFLGQSVRGVAIHVPDGAEAVHVYGRDEQLLAKVLPAGGPLVSTHWTCPTCGLTMPGQMPRVCMDDCNPECPIGGAP